MWKHHLAPLVLVAIAVVAATIYLQLSPASQLKAELIVNKTETSGSHVNILLKNTGGKSFLAVTQAREWWEVYRFANDSWIQLDTTDLYYSNRPACENGTLTSNLPPIKPIRCAYLTPGQEAYTSWDQKAIEQVPKTCDGKMFSTPERSLVESGKFKIETCLIDKDKLNKLFEDRNYSAERIQETLERVLDNRTRVPDYKLCPSIFIPSSTLAKYYSVCLEREFEILGGS